MRFHSADVDPPEGECMRKYLDIVSQTFPEGARAHTQTHRHGRTHACALTRKHARVHTHTSTCTHAYIHSRGARARHAHGTHAQQPCCARETTIEIHQLFVVDGRMPGTCTCAHAIRTRTQSQQSPRAPANSRAVASISRWHTHTHTYMHTEAGRSYPCATRGAVLPDDTAQKMTHGVLHQPSIGAHPPSTSTLGTRSSHTPSLGRVPQPPPKAPPQLTLIIGHIMLTKSM